MINHYKNKRDLSEDRFSQTSDEHHTKSKCEFRKVPIDADKMCTCKKSRDFSSSEETSCRRWSNNGKSDNHSKRDIKSNKEQQNCVTDLNSHCCRSSKSKEEHQKQKNQTGKFVVKRENKFQKSLSNAENLGGGLDCRRCGRKVYHAEMQVVSGSAYHKICFSCFCCRKLLDPITFQEHSGDIFCKQCYVRKFGPQGYGYGVGAGVLQTPL